MPPNPKTNSNLDPNPNPNQGVIFLGGKLSGPNPNLNREAIFRGWQLSGYLIKLLTELQYIKIFYLMMIAYIYLICKKIYIYKEGDT